MNTNTKDKIQVLVIKPSEIETKSCFNLASNDNLLLCDDCKSPLFYVKINWGVVAEENDYGIIGNKSNRVYCLRECGMTTFCSCCGCFNEQYSKYFYPEDKLIMSDFTLDEIGEDEIAELQVCLSSFNQSRTFEPRYKSNIFTELKTKLMEYELKHPQL